MAEFFLDPSEYQSQIDSYRTATETVAALQYAAEKGGLKLQSVDKYMECVTAMNDLIKAFGEFANKDADTMQQIKAKWMNTDGELATKTLVEILGSFITGK